jgi:hypothetical protein
MKPSAASTEPASDTASAQSCDPQHHCQQQVITVQLPLHHGRVTAWSQRCMVTLTLLHHSAAQSCTAHSQVSHVLHGAPGCWQGALKVALAGIAAAAGNGCQHYTALGGTCQIRTAGKWLLLEVLVVY